jgi:enoyl-CoA hydratase
MEEGAAAVRQFVERGHNLFLKIERASKPVIAAVNGFCLGGGMELALACHIRVCSRQAVLGQPEINLGIIPGWGATQRLPRLVGPGKALELILTGERIEAEEAYRIGLVEQIAPPERVLEEAYGLASRIASQSRISVAAALEAVTEGGSESLEAGFALEKEQFVSLAATYDAHEGLNAFLEKREPAFKDQ